MTSFWDIKDKLLNLYSQIKKQKTEIYDYNSNNFFPTYFIITEFYLHANFRPDLFSWDRVVKMSPTERLEHAFSKAQTYLGIEKLLDPEGIVQCLISILVLLYNFEYLKCSIFVCLFVCFCYSLFVERIVRVKEVFFLLKYGTRLFIIDIILCLTISRILQEEI